MQDGNISRTNDISRFFLIAAKVLISNSVDKTFKAEFSKTLCKMRVQSSLLPDLSRLKIVATGNKLFLKFPSDMHTQFLCR